MNRTILVAVLAVGVLIPMPEAAERRFQPGVRFGLVSAAFDRANSQPTDPFAALDPEGKVGLMGGAFYDVRLTEGSPALVFTFGASYKLLRMNAHFATADTPPVLGDVRDYFHAIDLPAGVKVVHRRLNGQPFVGAGVVTDIIVADSRTIDFSSEPAAGRDAYTIRPVYRNRVNVGGYLSGGFEVPVQSYACVFEVRWVRWGRDNFDARTWLYGRGRNEWQFSVGIKQR